MTGQVASGYIAGDQTDCSSSSFCHDTRGDIQ